MKDSDIKTGHGSVITSVGFEIAPKAKVTYIPYNSLRGSDWVELLLQWFEANHQTIDIISMSLSWDTSLSVKVQTLKIIGEKYKIPFVVSSGNDGADAMGYPAIYDEFIPAGATTNLTSVAHYSQGGKELAIVAPSYIWYYTSDKYGEDTYTKDIFAQTGTSISTPFVAYGLALYLSWRNKNNMKKLNVFEVEKFLKANAQDLYEKGHDNRSGYGLFILPEKTTVNLYIGSESYLIDGVVHRMDTAPILKSKRTFVPIRFVAEALGFKVTWGGDIAGGNKKEVIIQNGNLKVNMIIGSSTYLVNDNKRKMDVKPFLQNKRTYVPIRFVAEALGAKVTWGGDTESGNRNEVIIEKE
jgi:hypothetical protein